MEKMILPLGNGIGVYEKGRLCVSMIDSSGSKKVGGRFVKTVNKFFSFLWNLALYCFF